MKNKIIKISLLCVAIALTLFVFYHIAKYDVLTNITAKDTNLKAQNSYIATLAKGEKNPSKHSYDVINNIPSFKLQYEKYPTDDDSFYTEIEGDRQKGRYGAHIIRIENCRIRENDGTVGECVERAYPNYCIESNAHIKWKTSYGIRKINKVLPPAISYIVTASNRTVKERQKAFWDAASIRMKDGKRLDGGINLFADKQDYTTFYYGNYNFENGDFEQEAKDYYEYDKEVREHNGLNPKNKTNVNDVTIELNKATKEYTAGPFNIEYINGIYGGVAFSGISAIKAVGYDKDGNTIKEVPINKVILADKTTGKYGKAQTPEYFEPAIPDGITGTASSVNQFIISKNEDRKDYKEDRSKQVYPAPKQNFKVIFKFGEEDERKIAFVGFRVEFKYMLVDGKYNELYPIYTESSQTLIVPEAFRTLYEQYIDLNKIEVKPRDGSYNLQLLKVDSTDSNVNLAGAKFDITIDGTTKNYTTDSKGQISIKDQKLDESKNEKTIKITVKETEAPKGYARILKDAITINITVGVKDNQYAITNMTSDTKTGATVNWEEDTTTIKITVQNKRVVNLGGYVWEDVPSGKENIANGQKDDIDRPLKNVKVTLHTKDGTPIELGDPNEAGLTEEQIMHRVNPTYTDANGRYLFEELNPTKQYYVTFEYNGQTYLPTDYKKSGVEWTNSSKATEKVADRTNYNNKFAEIGSAPLNYVSSNSLNSGKLILNNGKYLNESFSQYDLMGFVLNTDGNYQKTGTILIDGFYKIENGDIVETTTIQEGVISQKIREYITANKKSPDQTAMLNIYRQIAGNDTELWRKIQFIEDCKITSYTQAQGAARYDLYPTNGEDEFYINLGLWRRQEEDLALRKDIAYAATKVNGKTEIYKYDNRENKDYWEIQLRMKDYNNYYASTYKREVYPADYNYRETNEHSGSELELYVTYKITVRNGSASILNEVKEIVDYYDKDYTYMNNLSWVMYKSNSNAGNEELVLKEDDYRSTMENLSLQGDLKNNAKPIKSSYSTSKNSYGTYTGSSKYGDNSKQDMEKQYNAVYIQGLADKKLASGEEAYVYLTFKVNEDNSNKVILDNDSSLKQNYIEINGYATYYKDGTKLPNGQTMRSSDVAGLIDINSNPGNLCLKDLEGEKAERNFENDTDRAKGLKVTVDNNFVRSVNGTVWEDQRTYKIAGAVIGDGIRQNNEIGVQGVTVELIEKLANGKEYTWAITTTDKNGHYEFKTNEDRQFYIIPGNYIVRFHYGDTDATVLTSKNGGGNLTSYNGQDFKSTVYQKDMNTSKTLNKEDGKYDIEEADNFGKNISDAKDIWSRREAINKYSNNNGKGVTNHLAEVLSSPYANTINSELIRELRENTNMTAETGIIVFEGEYNRKTSNGVASENGKYTLNNLDFGLTERPKAGLELNKKITNIKVTLANGSTLFDTNKKVKDLTWTEGTPYELDKKMQENKYPEYYNKNHRYAYRLEVDKLVSNRYNGLSSNGNGLIQIIMDEEIMHGSTIKITYELQVTNIGETDYEGEDFYYKATAPNKVVTTNANVLLDYVANNLQFRETDNSNNWKKVENIINTEGVSGKLSNSISEYNTIIKTEKLSSDLKPTEHREVELVLIQLITPQNTSDDKTYNNIAEITTISNSVGRRMAYSVQGNQDPTAMPTEVDSVKSEKVVILPPFGIGNIVVYTTLATVVLAILIAGIVLIKKKVIVK